MPTIKQLPLAASVNAADVLPVSQGGTTRGLTVAGLLSSTQAALSLVPGKLLGRASGSAGGPEPVSVGAGLSLAAGVIAATGADHAQLPVASELGVGDEVVLNAGGTAKRMPASLLRGLFSAGAGVSIDGRGTISASPSVVPGPPATAVAATASVIGGVRPGAGLTVAADGTLSADAAGLVAHLGLGGAATRNVGTVGGTVAAGDDPRITGALAAGVASRSYFPSFVARSGGAVELQAAQDEVQGAGGGLITVRSGGYPLAANVYTAGMNCWLFQRGASLSGSGQVDAVTDGQALGSSGLTLARLLSSTANEHGLHVTSRLAPTAGTVSYEKTGVYVRLLTHDPSSYSAPVALRDAVAFEGQASIAPGNLSGRAWGINTGAGPEPGADGYAVGGEFGTISSSGSDAGPLGTPTSKIGVHCVAYGDSTSTAGLVVSGNGTTFQDGLVVSQQAISSGGHALSVRPVSSGRDAGVAWISREGSAQFTGQVGVRSGATGVRRMRALTATTSGGSTTAKLTMDGGAPASGNTLTLAANTAVSVRAVRFLVFDTATGWAGTYRSSEILAVRGASVGSITLVPSSPTITFEQQAGTPPGALGLSITADTVNGRLDFNVATTTNDVLRWVAEVETVEST